MIPDLVTLAIFDPADIVMNFLTADAGVVYLLVFSLMVIESSFIPFPSEIIVPPAAYLACTKGDVNLVAIILLATAGSIVGALINYYLALWIGRPIIYRFASSRAGHTLLLNEEKVRKAETYFDRHGAISTFIGRLVPAVRQLISIPAGLARINMGTFVTFTGLGAGVWNCVLAGLGYWLGSIVAPGQLYAKVEEYNAYLSYAGWTLGGICLLFIIWTMLKPRRPDNTL